MLNIGGQSGELLQIDPSHRAARMSLRPLDVGAQGGYRLSAMSGAIAATLAAAAVLFSMRWSDSSGKKMALTDLQAGFIVDGAITTAVPIVLEAVAARSFTASDTGGTGLTLSGNNNKLQTSFGSSLVGDARIATTAALAAGTRTLDTQGFGMTAGNSGTTAGSAVGPNSLLRPSPGVEFPLILSQNEGFVIRSVLTGPATGTFRLIVAATWEEVSSYNNVANT